MAKRSDKIRSDRIFPPSETQPRNNRRWSWIVALFLLAGSVRITATYDELSRTGDEQAHIATGMEYLDKGTYTYEAQHPPLTRIMAALLPYLNGAHSWGMASMWYEGGAVLYRDGNYAERLRQARTGILPFFWLGGAMVFLWARRYFDPLTGVIATGVYSLTPTVLAHAGLATTDMGLAAFFVASLLSTLMLLETPHWRSGALFGLTLGLAICSKFSFLAFYPASLLCGLVAYAVLARPNLSGIGAKVREIAGPGAIGVAVAFVTIWTVYGFSFGTSAMTGTAAVPFPELFNGIQEVIDHNEKGHAAYLLGRTSESGFWYYYPVVLFFKLPIPLLILIGLGIARGWAQHRLPTGLLLAFSVGVLVVGATSRINIGVRHVLPLFLFFAIFAAVEARAVFGWEEGGGIARWRRNAILLLLVWLGFESVGSHPDYLAYFNQMALGKPERIAVDSDLDWQQDVKRAAKRMRDLGIREVAFRPFNAFTEDFADFPRIVEFDAVHPAAGWNLVSTTNWKAWRYQVPEGTPLWMERIEPVERIGKGLLLYRIEREAASDDGNAGR